MINVTSFECKECIEGTTEYYDDKLNKIICIPCPKNSYSTGSFNKKYRGQYGEFNRYFIQTEQFNPSCGVFKNNIQQNNISCKGWEINSNSQSIDINNKNINNSTPDQELEIRSDFRLFSKNFLYSEFLITFHYSNNIENNTESLFTIEINHHKEFEIYLNDTKNTNTFTFSKMTDTVDNMINFAFKSKLINNISLSIDSIEIKGVIGNNNTCKPCSIPSPEGSPFCGACDIYSYYDEKEKSCLNCPSKYFTRRPGSIGRNKCVQIPLCDPFAFKRKISPYCNQETNKFDEIYYQKVNNCFICPGEEKIVSKLIEEDLKNGLEINCFDCPIGTYKSFEPPNRYICLPCKPHTFSSEKNKLQCEICPHNSSTQNIEYFFFPSHQKTIKTEIKTNHITKEQGILRIVYTQLVKENNDFWDSQIKLLIDDSELYDLINSPTDVIYLSEGKHIIRLVHVPSNYIINYISIQNSVHGGGYACNENFKAPIHVQSSQCFNHPDSYYEPKNKTCVKCPIYTLPNQQKTGCDIAPFISYKKENLYFNLEQIQDMAESVCQSNPSLCFNNYFGPLINPLNQNELFFFSRIIMDSIFTDKKRDLSKGYIYRLGSFHNIEDEVETSLGSTIDFIKILNSKESKGLVIKLVNGDKCDKDVNKQYSSFVLLRCENHKNSMEIPKLIKQEKCTYYFEWKTSVGCPICLKSQVWSVESRCIDSEKFQYNFEEEELCTLAHFEESKGIDEKDEKKALLNENEDSYIKYIYHFSFEKNISNETIYEDLVKKDVIIKSCRGFKISILWTLFFCTIFISTIAFACIYCNKYKKLIKDYQRLDEIELPTVKTKTSNNNSVA